MRRTTSFALRLLLVLLASASVASVSTAQHPRHSKHADARHVQVIRGRVPDYRHYDRRHDERIVVQYFRAHPGRGRGGGHVPPGLARYVVRDRVLPATVRVYAMPAPVVLVRQLPPLRYDYAYMTVGTELMVVHRPSWMVVDLFVAL